MTNDDPEYAVLASLPCFAHEIDKNGQLGKLFTMGDFDNPVYIDKVLLKRDRLPKELFFIPALLLLGIIIFLQRRRQRKLQPHGEAVAAL